jgi:pimeloyl-ACP methyl ester carboxylesterase
VTDKILLFMMYYITVPICQVSGGIDLRDFVEKEVVVKSEGAALHGTLLIPDHHFQGTVALIIAGSGPTDRNGNQFLMANNSLKMLAHNLAKKGIASLRYDKRGVMASIPKNFRESDLRFDDYIRDAQAWLRWLQADRNFQNIFVIGHSEGSLIGMMAARQANITGYISLAGTGRNCGDLILDQLAPNMDVDQLQVVAHIIDSLQSGHPVSQVPKDLNMLFRASVQPYLISWMQYDPTEEISKLGLPVLIIQGEKDLQVSAHDGEQLHQASQESDFVIIEYMNHVLKDIQGGIEENRASYTDPTLPLSGELTTRIVDFIRRSTETTR